MGGPCAATKDERERRREREHARVGDARVRKKRESDESDNAVEGSEEHFDESEHVGDLAEEERSTDGEDGFGEEVDETRENERQGCRSSEGSENEGEGCRGPEGSDFAAEESCEEGGPDMEEGYEDVWDEVQEALSAMEHEEFDDTTEADLCARSQASRLSSASSQASVRS